MTAGPAVGPLAGSARPDPADPAPAVARTSLFSYLVTRHTGRAVRMGIRDRLTEFDRRVLTVLDFRDVQLIDFSCADEVVAKLVVETFSEPAFRGRAFVLVAGLDERHVDPIDSALRRQRLAVAAEGLDGAPLILGAVEELAARAWREVCRLGRAPAGAVSRALGAPERTVCGLLDVLDERRLLLREGAAYVSFRTLLREAEAGGSAAG